MIFFCEFVLENIQAAKNINSLLPTYFHHMKTTIIFLTLVDFLWLFWNMWFYSYGIPTKLSKLTNIAPELLSTWINLNLGFSYGPSLPIIEVSSQPPESKTNIPSCENVNGTLFVFILTNITSFPCRFFSRVTIKTAGSKDLPFLLFTS